MTITWYGQSCFRVETREATIAIDPFSKEIGLTPPRFHADVVLVSHSHPDHANAAAIPGNPTCIANPGEYEVKGVAIHGIPTFHDAREGKERGLNTAFRIEGDSIVLAHLGDFGESALRPETLEALGAVDVLLVPVGGTYTIGPGDSAKIVQQIEPRIVIPMHYHLPGLKFKLAPVDDFLKALGARNTERLEKLTVKKKDLPEAETRVVVLSAASLQP